MTAKTMTILDALGRDVEVLLPEGLADNAARTNGTSTGNSSETPLGIAGVFTGEWEDVSAYESVVIAVATDVSGDYSVQFSPDGVNIDSSLSRYYRSGEINAPHRFTVTRNFFRVVYTNGGTAQTYFRLQTHFGQYQPLNAPLDGILARDFDAIVVRPTDHDDEITLGLRQGFSSTLKFGYREGVTNSATPVVIAPFATTWTKMSVASTLTLVSTSTEDDNTPGGTGARTVLVSGINANRDAQSEVVALNGTSSVVTTGSWLGINRVVVLTSGTSQANVGIITCTATTGGVTQARIPAGVSVTQQLIFHTRANHKALIKAIYINVLKLSGGTSPRVTVRLRVWNPAITDTIYTLRRFKLDTSVSNTIAREFEVPLLLNPTDVAWLDVVSDQNSTDIDAEMDIVEVENADSLAIS